LGAYQAPHHTADAATSPLIRWLDLRLDVRAGSSARGRARTPPAQHRGRLECLFGIAALSLFSALVKRFVVIGNLSLLYLLVLLYRATRYARTPAILASVLAFLA
jgi:K+-sensing histidine kinase KdpD